MTNITTRALSILRWVTCFCGLTLAGFAGFHFFDAYAQAEATDKAAPERILVNGRLVYVRQSYGGAPDSVISHSNSDGSASFTLPLTASLTPQYPTWSPDGTKIAYTIIQTPNDIWSINADGGGATNLTNTGNSFTESHPSWSVTGKIAYSRGGQIWTMNSNGSDQAQFTTITGGAGFSAWSPDGSKLAFVNNNEIWVINSDGTNQRQVTMNTSADSQPDWSPDGTKIIFMKGSSGLSVVLDYNRAQKPITTVASDRIPAWSPDGKQITL
jgi:TolB protein